jgi:uncharacterized protein YdhG (YjbR/CyaY superfamily)
MKSRSKKPTIRPGGVDEYIATWPKDVQGKLRDIRASIREVAPDATETVSYFDMPGYSYEGYDYNGMFVWFSFKAPFVRLHLRPPTIANHKSDLKKYATTAAIVSFPIQERIPKTLVKRLVRASLKLMKGAVKK